MMHAYSVLDTVELRNEETGEVEHRLFLIRNPWGVTSFNGTWNYNDTESWTDSFKSQVNFDPSRKGTFFIEDVDFVKAFEMFEETILLADSKILSWHLLMDDPYN